MCSKRCARRTSVRPSSSSRATSATRTDELRGRIAKTIRSAVTIPTREQGAAPSSSPRPTALLLRRPLASGARDRACGQRHRRRRLGGDRLDPRRDSRALVERRPIEIRNPDAVRPWQHVLNAVDGYLALAETPGPTSRPRLLLELRPRRRGRERGSVDRRPHRRAVGRRARRSRCGAGAAARGDVARARRHACQGRARLASPLGSGTRAARYRRVVSRPRRGRSRPRAGARADRCLRERRGHVGRRALIVLMRP